MGWIRRLWTTVHRGLFRHAQADRDLDDELRFHRAQETQLLVDSTPFPTTRTGPDGTQVRRERDDELFHLTYQ